MPALAEEIEAALQEGVALETLSSPIRIDTHEGRLAGIECIRNKLGDRDETGRRSPLPIPGTEYTFPADTLIVAVGEEPEGKAMVAMGIAPDEGNTVKVNPETFCTNREGVFAGGDLATAHEHV